MRLKHSLFIILLLVLIINIVASCTPYVELQGKEKKFELPSNKQVRPDIPRANINEFENNNGLINSNNENEEVVNSSFLNQQSLFVVEEDKGLRVGNDDEPFIIGKKLGEIVPYLEEGDLQILYSKNIAYSQYGSHGFNSRSYIRFDFSDEKDESGDEIDLTSGVLRYDYNDDTEESEVQLFFERDKPVFEYAYLLDEGTFMSFVGQQMDFFGHTYLIQESENNSLLLNGVDIARYIDLVNNSRLSINGENIAHTHVEVTPYYIIIRVFGNDDYDDDGIILRKGDSLQDKMDKRVFLHELFNVYFDGVDSFNANTVKLNSFGDRVKINYHNLLGENLDLRLLRLIDGKIVYDQEEDGDYKIHIQECSSRKDYCISRGDSLLLVSQEGVNNRLRYVSSSEFGKLINFYDENNELNVVKTSIKKRYDNESLKKYNEENNITHETMVALEREGALMFGDDVYKVYVYYNRSTGLTNISVDLNADGSINEKSVPIVFEDGHKLVLENNEDDYGLRFVYVSQNMSRVRSFVDENYYDYQEIVPIYFTIKDDEIMIDPDLNFTQYQDENNYTALTNYGVEFILDNANGDYGEKLTINAVPGYREGIVTIRG